MERGLGLTVFGVFGYRVLRLRRGRELPTAEEALAPLGVFDALFTPR